MVFHDQNFEITFFFAEASSLQPYIRITVHIFIIITIVIYVNSIQRMLCNIVNYSNNDNAYSVTLSIITITACESGSRFIYSINNISSEALCSLLHLCAVNLGNSTIPTIYFDARLFACKSSKKLQPVK